MLAAVSTLEATGTGADDVVLLLLLSISAMIAVDVDAGCSDDEILWWAKALWVEKLFGGDGCLNEFEAKASLTA